ncbi:MAG: pseudouridine synthase [Bacillota bacterium]
MELDFPILYEDNHLIAVVKPANLPVQADSSGDEDLLSLLKSYIKEKYQKPGDVYLGLVHRLDRPVGGVMVFARTSKAAARLTEQFRSHAAKKQYAALTREAAPVFAKLSDYLLKDEKTNTVSVVDAQTPGAKAASLSFRLAARENGLSLLNVSLNTGRPHQIRVQLKNAGLPIHGDARYNPDSRPGEQIALFGYALTLSHPTTKQQLRFCALPEGGVWRAFSGALESLSGEPRTVYQDENILVVNKPRGMTTAAADGGEKTLEDALCGQYGEIYPVHRLDANTGGLVLFARNPAAREALDAAIEAHAVKKTYRCIVRGTPASPEATLTAYQKKDAENARVAVFPSPAPGAKTIVTRYRVLKSDGRLSLLEVEPVTGRTHQIRAHLAFAGYPLLGDERYGDWALNKAYSITQQALWAVRLELSFPGDSALRYLDGKAFSCSAPFAL